MPISVRWVAVGTAVLAVGAGLLIALIGSFVVYVLHKGALGWSVASDPPLGPILFVLSFAGAISLTLLAIARGLWTGSGNARLAAQILFALLAVAQAYLLLPARDWYSHITELRLVLGAFAILSAAATLCLERSAARAAFGLQPYGRLRRYLSRRS